MDFFDALVRYETDLWNHLDRCLAEAGQVSLATLEGLRVIARHNGSARVMELQDELRITVGAASKHVDRLERDGLAMRHPNPDDRRSSLLALTEEGRKRHDSGMRVLEQHVPSDPSGLTEVLRRMTNELGVLA